MRSIACAWLISLAPLAIALSASGGTSQSSAPQAISSRIEGGISVFGARYDGRRHTYDYLDPWRWDGLEFDLFWDIAPFDYPALGWDAVPYHFADENYYAWHAGALAYELEHTPPEVEGKSAGADATTTGRVAYP
jgi:hypothetical protein